MQRNNKSSQNLTAKIATFNVHGGLNNQFQRELIYQDMAKSKIDVMCLQEMKLNEELALINRNNQAIYGFKSRNTNPHRNYSMAFIISERWTNYLIEDPNYINDRICKIAFNLPGRSGKNIKIVILNVYAPTMHTSNTNMRDVEYFCLTLEIEYNRAKGNQNENFVFLCGDFNAKIGRRSNNENFMGNHSRGRRNSNGERLANFVNQNGLYIANTAF
jgi:exonuclease III